MKWLIGAALMVATLGCAPETRTRIEDRPDTTPMELPEWGWTISFTKTLNDGDPMEPEQIDCTIVSNESGAAADYCGYNIYVTQDAFSFDTRPYRAVSWYYGPIVVDVTGAGDVEGAEIDVRVDYADSQTWEPIGLAYKVHYKIEHLKEIDWARPGRNQSLRSEELTGSLLTPESPEL